MTQWPPRASAASAPNADKLLIAAIRADDHAGFYAALKAVADVNAQDGIFLQTAAEVNNQLFMKELMLAGADIDYAHNKAYAQMAPIKYEYKSSGAMYDMGHRVFKNAGDEAKYMHFQRITERLHNYRNHFVEKVKPIETVRFQKTIMAELEALRRELTELREGKPLDKKPLSPPAGMSRQAPR